MDKRFRTVPLDDDNCGDLITQLMDTGWAYEGHADNELLIFSKNGNAGKTGRGRTRELVQVPIAGFPQRAASKDKKPNGLTKIQRRVFNALGKSWVARGAIANKTGLSSDQVSGAFVALRRRGMIEHNGKSQVESRHRRVD